MRLLMFVSVFLFLALPAWAGLQFGDPFVLPVGGHTTVGAGEVVVGFDGILGDSRCPTGVWCFWPGDAEAALWVEPAGGSRHYFTLHTYYEFEQSLEVGAFTVCLQSVKPYPVEGETIAPDDYTVTLTVLKAAVGLEYLSWDGLKSRYR